MTAGSWSSIVFLDIDGVLNNERHATWLHENVQKGAGFGMPWELESGNITPETVGWDPANLEALWHIIDETDAKIVVSSTWRLGRRSVFFREISKVAFGRALPVIDITPVINEIGSIRGDEVNQWLEGAPMVERWVCLDDDGDFHPNNNLVQTNMEVGLTMEDARRAIEILKG